MFGGFPAGLPGQIAALLSHLTTYLAAARCALIDRLDATITSRAPSSTALSNTMWTDAKAGYLDMAVSGVARIKSIQHIASYQLSGTDPVWVTKTITISAVNPAKTIVIFNGSDVRGSIEGSGGRLQLLNSTQLYFAAARNSATNENYTINAVVVEFY